MITNMERLKAAHPEAEELRKASGVSAELIWISLIVEIHTKYYMN